MKRILRCLSNFLWYGKWSPCQHEWVYDTSQGPIANQDFGDYVCVCSKCGDKL